VCRIIAHLKGGWQYRFVTLLSRHPVGHSAAALCDGENVQLPSPYTLDWNHTIDVSAGIDAIPEAAHLSKSNIYVKPVTLFADTVQNRVQAVTINTS
jgi:hypothetical protein